MLVKEAKKIIGSLGRVSKMPLGCFTYGLPAGNAYWVPDYCKHLGLPIPPRYGCTTGGLLSMQKDKNTVCSKCYADNRGNYTYESLKIGQVLRLHGVYDDRWVDAMSMLINRYSKIPYFRWHDSGDLLGIWHLEKIIEVANLCSDICFWLPTQEHQIIRLTEKKIPNNLVIRESSIYIDKPPINNNKKIHRKTFPVSAVSTNGYTCKAPYNDHNCGDCRDCWDSKVESVIYQAL